MSSATENRIAPPLSLGKQLVELGDNRSVLVRHAKYGKKTQIMQAVAVLDSGKDGDSKAVELTGSLAVIGDFCRWGVVDAKGLQDDDGQDYTLEYVPHDTLKAVASPGLLDCLEEQEIVQITMAIGGMSTSDSETPGDEGDKSDEGN